MHQNKQKVPKNTKKVPKNIKKYLKVAQKDKSLVECPTEIAQISIYERPGEDRVFFSV